MKSSNAKVALRAAVLSGLEKRKTRLTGRRNGKPLSPLIMSVISDHPYLRGLGRDSLCERDPDFTGVLH